MKTWLKAGLIGGIVGVILTLPAFLAFYIPFSIGSLITICASIIFFLLYPGVGALAAFWLPTPRTAQQGAMDGALAGLIAFGIDSIVTIVVTLLIALTGGIEQYLQQLAPYSDPEVLAMANTLGVGSVIVFSCINVLTGAALSALGGLIFASVKPD